MPQSPSKQAPWDLTQFSPNHHQLSRCISLKLINGLKSLPFKGDFSFGKSQK